MSMGSSGVSSYLSPVMSMSVAKPIVSQRAKRSSDSFEDFDLNKKSPVVSHVIQYEYRKLWWKNQVPENAQPEVESESIIAAIEGNPATFKVPRTDIYRGAGRRALVHVCLDFVEESPRAGVL